MSNSKAHMARCVVHDQDFTPGGRCPTCAADVAEKTGALGQDLPNYGKVAANEADLIVTKGGVPFEDQAEGVRQFKAACLSANDRQVGGAHYKVPGLQHWDLVHVFGLDYYSGNATKYLSRAHKKNGAQDYGKSVHYQDKRAELTELKDRAPYIMPEIVVIDGKLCDPHQVLWDFCREQDMPLMAVRAFFALMQGRVEDARSSTLWLAENYSANS